MRLLHAILSTESSAYRCRRLAVFELNSLSIYHLNLATSLIIVSPLLADIDYFQMCIQIVSSIPRSSSSLRLLIPTVEFGWSAVNCKLLTASTKDSSSWKDNRIDTRTRIMVGVMP